MGSEMAISPTAIKVTVSDPETGEVFEEQVIDNDYLLLCAGTAYLAHTQTYGNGTHMLKVCGRQNGSKVTP